jgi:hypothetical protein
MNDFDKAIASSFRKIEDGSKTVKLAMGNALNPQLGGQLVTVTKQAGEMNVAFQALSKQQLAAAQAGAQQVQGLQQLTPALNAD